MNAKIKGNDMYPHDEHILFLFEVEYSKLLMYIDQIKI
jgi:hypothetical protein